MKELRDRAILGAVVGSKAMGLETGSDDIDEMWVCLPTRKEVLGFDTDEWSVVKRDRPEGVRSEPGDRDRVYHSLMKWMRLAMKLNPSILMPVFVKSENLIKDSYYGKLVRLAGMGLVSKRLYYPFKGYMISQWERLIGERGQMRVSRPELVAKYGYDTKYAYHVVRLGLEAIELLSTGQLEIPYQGTTKKMLMDIREGKYAWKEFEELYQYIREQLDIAFEKSTLREGSNVEMAEVVVMEIYEDVVNMSTERGMR
jgi:predicted nucleotidyltransferase